MVVDGLSLGDSPENVKQAPNSPCKVEGVHGKQSKMDVMAEWVDRKAAENMNSRAAIADAKRQGSKSPLSRSNGSLPRPPSDELLQLLNLANDLQNAQKASKLSDVSQSSWLHWGFCAACSTVGAAYGISKAVWNNLPAISSSSTEKDESSPPGNEE